MMVVDSSVWIDHLKGTPTLQVEHLQAVIRGGQDIVVMGDLVLTEVLQGITNEGEARRIEASLRRFVVVSMVGDAVAVQSGANYRALRSLGVTIRRTIDLLIGTFCIEQALPLLHSDRAFDPMERHLGLVVVRPSIS